jgi:hypothetical protein
MANPLAPVTLTAATVATFTLDADYPEVEVINLSAIEAYFSVDGSTPTVGGAFYVLAGVIGDRLRVKSPSGSDAVKVISSGTPKIAVRGIR